MQQDFLVSSTLFWRKMKNKKVAITGASGFVGRALATRLTDLGAELVLISRTHGIDITDYQKLKLATSGVDYIFHCAAIDGNSTFKKKHSNLILQQNNQINENILRVTKENNVKKLVLLSSAEVYEKRNDRSLAETDVDFTSFEDITDGYRLSKIQAEQLATEYSQNHGLDVLIIRPTNIYGPGDEKMRLISFLIEKLERSETITLFNNGNQKRKFVFIADFVEVLLQLIAKDMTGIFNVAPDDVYSIKEIVDKVAKILHKTAVTENMSVDDQLTRDLILDTSKLNSIIDFEFTKTDDGLKATIKEKL